jgi:hypothetical protein
MTRTESLGRPLSLGEHAVVLWVLAALPDRAVAELLHRQSIAAVVTGGPLTMLELAIPAPVPPAPIADGPLPARAAVCDHDGAPLGELLLWMSAGYLSAIEYAWYTDIAPAELPAPSDLRLE